MTLGYSQSEVLSRLNDECKRWQKIADDRLQALARIGVLVETAI